MKHDMRQDAFRLAVCKHRGGMESATPDELTRLYMALSDKGRKAIDDTMSEILKEESNADRSRSKPDIRGGSSSTQGTPKG